MTFQNKRLAAMLLLIPALLLIPLTAMYYGSGFNWTVFDFVVMGLLLLGTALLVELVLRNVKKGRNRLLLLGVVFLIMFLLWVELAVGIIGSPLAGS